MTTPVRERRSRWGRSAGPESLLRSPAYLGALLLHAVFLLVISGFTIVSYVVEPPAEVTVRLVTLKEVAAPVPEQDRVLAGLELPDPSAAVDVDLSFDEAMGSDPGVAAAAGPTVAFGLAGAAGFGRGGSRDARGGPTGESGAALSSGLAWLARHRSGDGAWGILAAEHRNRGELPPDGEMGRTGLALLAFLMAGHEPDKPGPYRDLVREARDWLVAGVRPNGRVATARDEAYVQAIVTLTLAEALAREEDPQVRAAVERATRCIEAWQGRGGGFRYQPKGDSDTSVTSWMVLGLRSAESAGVAVDPQVWKGVREYIEYATDPNGETGYVGPGGGSPAMNATGLFLRVLLGEPPTTPRNLMAAKQVAQQVGNIGPGGNNLYHLYYAQLALFQVGGEPWRTTNPKVRDGLVRGATRGGGCEDGSWGFGGNWGYDPVLATSFAVLCLETYFRYLPTHAREGETEQAPERSDPVFDQLCAASEALDRAGRGGEAAELLVAEAAGEEALRLTEGLPPDERKGRARDVARLLLQVALVAGDAERLAERLKSYDALVPANAPLEPSIEELRREVELLAWRKRLVPALGPGGAPAARRALREELVARRATLATEAAAAPPERRGWFATLGGALGALEEELAVAVSADGGEDPAALLAARPAEGPVTGPERALVLLVARAAAGALERGALAEHETRLRQLRGRNLLERLPKTDPLRSLLGQLEAARLVQLARDGRHAEALAGASAWWNVFARDQGGELVERAELEGLLGLFRGNKADVSQRARLAERLLAHAASAPPLEVGPLLRATGELLIRQGDEEPGRRLVARARELVGPGGETVELCLVLARADRAAGKGDQALAALDALPAPARKRVDVQRERHLTLLALGRPKEALEDAQQLLRAVKEDTPEWWDAVDDLARLQVAAGDAAAARELVEGARRKLPGLGGEARKKKMIALMHWLDTLR